MRCAPAVRAELPHTDEDGPAVGFGVPEQSLFLADMTGDGLSDIVRVFFNGSPASAASALLGMSGKLKEDELDKLEQMIARARKAKGGQ